MFKATYKNFDDMYYNVNREFFLHPEMITTLLSDSGYVENVVIGCKSWKCTLDLSMVGYKKTKWGHLLNTYIDYDELVKFKEKLDKVTGVSFTFYFKQKKKNNGSCLIAIVFTRQNRLSKWTGMKVLYRATETQRRMAADLVMLNRFITELPECCDIKNVVFMMAFMYCDARFINGFFDYFNIDRSTLDYTNPFIRQLKTGFERYFQKDSEMSKFMSLATMQRLYLGIDKYEPVNIEELSIKGHFEKENKK